MAHSQELQHPGCKATTGFLALKTLGEAFTLHRDPADKKIPCPRCPECLFNMDAMKVSL